MDLDAYVRARRAEVDAALTAVLPSPPESPAPLAEAMRYSVTAGGKRLRPILCLAGCDAVGGNRDDALPAACALELIHTYSLIHDDLPAMDNDTLRRGMPTLHVVAGEALAILAGDGLLTEAFALLAREPQRDDALTVSRKLRVIARVAAAAGAAGMVGGQVLDIEAETSPDSGSGARDPEALTRMHRMKTGALIRAAATAGAIMGGGTPRQIDAIDAAAAEFGLAFQIVDDILDVVGGTELGKTAGKDAAAGKITYPALYGLDASRTMAADCLVRAEAHLRDGGIADPHLLAIGRWIVERRS